MHQKAWKKIRLTMNRRRIKPVWLSVIQIGLCQYFVLSTISIMCFVLRPKCFAVRVLIGYLVHVLLKSILYPLYMFGCNPGIMKSKNDIVKIMKLCWSFQMSMFFYYLPMKHLVKYSYLSTATRKMVNSKHDCYRWRSKETLHSC